MQRFSITPIVDYAGRKYFVVNYPRRGTSGRKQKKFNSLESAEEFCSEIKREWLNTGKIRLGLDSHLHCDVMRAVKLLSGVPNASLERAANVFMQCRSMMEKRGSGVKYEVPVNRRVELSPRFFLLVVNEAKARNVSMNEAVEGLLSEVALCRADQAIRQKIHTEEREYRGLNSTRRFTGTSYFISLPRFSIILRHCINTCAARSSEAFGTPFNSFTALITSQCRCESSPSLILPVFNHSRLISEQNSCARSNELNFFCRRPDVPRRG